MSMTSEQQRNVFRIAAIIYGRSRNGVSLNKSYQRVIDDALYRCGKESITLTELIVFINDEYGLLYSAEEIEDVVIKGRDASQCYYCYDDKIDLMISLTGEYKNKLSLVCGQKTLYDYIDEYLALYNIENVSSKDLILRFLYEMFTTNLEGYKLILHEKIDSLGVDNSAYTEDEKAIINDFLNWPDEGKDKAIYDLAGYSLEYCMMTNQKNTSINVQNLKGKSFYIDTNVVYRALGLNSDNLKARAHLFLSKFKEVGEYLYISHSTYLEFVDTIDYYVNKIDNSLRPKVQSKVISEFINEDSIFHYYHKWCIGRVNRDTRYFKDWVMSEFDNLCKKYDIKHEVDCPYDRNENQDRINEYLSGILSADSEKPMTSAEYDAENVLWVEEKRKGCSDDIYQANAFLLSSDNKLRRWDYLRNTHRVPIVMSPNQWLNVILHYVERTADDYRSFVSFLTLTVRRESLSIETLSTIVSGIAEATSDIEQQQNLVRNFIERNTFDEIEKMSDDTLESQAKEFAKTELEKRIEELESKQKEQETELSKTHRTIDDTLEALDELKKSSAEEINRINAQMVEEARAKGELDKENKELREALNNTMLRTWKAKKISLWSVTLLISIVCCVLVFFWQDESWNFMAILLAWIAGMTEIIADQYGKAILGLPLTLLVYSCVMIKDACDVSEYDKKKLRFLWKSKNS